MGKRKLIYLPNMFPETFVFFFQKGNDQTSFSIRDYSVTPVKELSGKTDFSGITANHILDQAVETKPAKRHPTTDETSWKEWITEANVEHEKRTGEKMKRLNGRAIDPDNESSNSSVAHEDIKNKYEHWKANAPRRHQTKKKYFVEGHNGIPSTGNHTNRGEEHLALALFNRFNSDNLNIDLNGRKLKLLDYQFPLKAAQKDKIGKIDLVGIEDDGRLCVIELKAWDNVTDTPGKALLQALEYAAAVDANLQDIRYERSDVADLKPSIVIMAPKGYWQSFADSIPQVLVDDIHSKLSIPVYFISIDICKDDLILGLNQQKPQLKDDVTFKLLGSGHVSARQENS